VSRFPKTFFRTPKLGHQSTLCLGFLRPSLGHQSALHLGFLRPSDFFSLSLFLFSSLTSYHTYTYLHYTLYHIYYYVYLISILLMFQAFGWVALMQQKYCKHNSKYDKMCNSNMCYI